MTRPPPRPAMTRPLVKPEAKTRRRNDCICILSALMAVLLLATACSAAGETTVTASPTDIVAAPGVTPDGTDGAVATPNDDAPSAVAPIDEPSTPTTPDDSNSDDAGMVVVVDYPEVWLTNRSDPSTPLGKLCWAFQEFIWADLVRVSQLMVDSFPGLEMALPDMGEEDENVGPVGVVNEESDGSSQNINEYFSDTLGSIQSSEIAGIVNDAGLSEELQLFAQAFFSYIAAYDKHLETVGYANFDNDSLPYQDIGNLPYSEEFDEAVEDNPDKCGIPSMEDIEEGSARFRQALAELLGTEVGSSGPG